MAEADYHNRFYRTAKEIIKTYGAIGPNELARRTGITPEAAYICLLSWRGTTAALRECGYLPTLEPDAIEAKALKVSSAGVVSLEEAKKLLPPGPQLLTGRISKRRGL
jgi:hypothetical protein